MNKLINISLILALFLALASCEKEDFKPNKHKDGIGCFGEYDNGDLNNRSSFNDANNGDPDSDLIVDPDDDEDFNSDEDGSIVDPDDDEDFDEDEGK